MASMNPAAASVPLPPPTPAPAINPMLLAAACSGSCRGLDFLLNMEDAPSSFYNDPLVAAYASGAVLTSESLLKGVTVEGDTALHAVATNGDSDDFLRCADIICVKAEHLLFVQNKRGDTPLHQAARAGKSEMVAHLIALAKGIVGGTGPAIAAGATRVKALVKMENQLKETALHEAVRVGRNNMVKLLMEEEPELARFPEEGTSPLYLAISLENKNIAGKLYGMSGGILSYSGPNGQNALHAAARQGPDLTKMLLGWNKELTTQEDKNGSTPLHFAAALLRPGNVCWQVLKANPIALYQSDCDGLFPIHVAASVGADRTIAMFLNKFPGCAALRDAKGRTFLHVAVEEKKLSIVFFARRNRSLSWILNMQDKDGNTALHLAVQEGSLPMVCDLLISLQVELNLTNEKGHTPLDISRHKIPLSGLFWRQSAEVYVRNALTMVGARSGASRQDHLNYKQIKEPEKIKEATQNFSIGSVLIATVTFGATFALPGGYRADDHENEGTPTCAGRYAFDAFIMANTLSFICSCIATVGFMFSGSSMVDLVSRRWYLGISVYLMRTSISSLTAAFALGVYVVLAPVALRTAIAVCVLSSLVVLSSEVEFWWKRFFLLPSLLARNGLSWTIRRVAQDIVMLTIYVFWPIIFIFVWAAIARNHP